MKKQRGYRNSDSEPEKKTLASKADTDPVGLVKELVAAADQAMGQTYQSWSRYRKKARHKWYMSDDLRKRPLYTTNYLFSKLNTVKSYMILQIPEPSVAGVENSDDPGAQYKQKLLDWALAGGQAGWRKAARGLIPEAEIASVAWLKTSYDPTANNGEGGPRLDVISAEWVKVDPHAASVEDARWLIHVRPDMDPEAIYAEHGKWPEVSGSSDGIGDGKRKGDNRPEEQKKAAPGQSVDLYELYLRDYTTEETEEIEEQLDPEMGEVIQVPVKGKKRTYPTYRVITVAGETLLDDKAFPYDHGECPLIPYKCDDDDTTLYPASMIEILEPLQDLADAIDEQIYRNIRLIANRQRIVSTGSGLKDGDITNQAGKIYFTNGDIDKAMKWDDPTVLGPEVFQYRKEIEERMDKVSGIFEVTQGRTESGVTAFSAIATLQDASSRTIQARLERLAEVAETMARQVLSLLKQYCPGSMTIRIAGGKELEIIDDYPDMLNIPGEVDEEGNEQPPITIGREEATPEQKAAWREASGIHVVLADIDERKDLEVSADTALPSSKAQRAKVAMDLFALEDTGNNVIDDEALLESLDWPGRSEVLRRKREKQAQMEEVKAQLDALGKEVVTPAPQATPQTANMLPMGGGGQLV